MKSNTKYDKSGKAGCNTQPGQKPSNGHQPRAEGRSCVAQKLRKLLPLLSTHEFADLKESIRRHNTVVPSIVDADGNVIDGEHRERACTELGIDCPKVIREFASEAEKLQLAIKLNVNRRHLTGKQRRELIALYLEVDSGINDRHLGNVIGVSKNTVAAERERLEASGQIDQLPQRIGRDGKLRPAKHRQIIANTPKEAEQARQLINTLPASCDGKILDVTTAARRSLRQVRKQHRDAQVVMPSPDEAIRAYCCRFQELEQKAGIAPTSVNAMITDFPYDGKFLPQVAELAELASRILVDGGLLATYCGQYYFGEVLDLLRKHLKFGWIISNTWDGPGNVIHPLGILSKWTPVVVCSKGAWRKRGRWPDVLPSNGQEKEWHDWQKPVEDVETLVRYLTQPRDLVVDPCGGAFTTAVACRNLGRRFIGSDISAECVSKGQARLVGLSPADWAAANQVEAEQDDGNERK